MLVQVFAGGELPGENRNALWSLLLNKCCNEKESYQDGTIVHGDTIYLYHKMTSCYLNLDESVKSPTTGHAEGILSFVYNKKL